jgi:endonuclease G
MKLVQHSSVHTSLLALLGLALGACAADTKEQSAATSANLSGRSNAAGTGASISVHTTLGMPDTSSTADPSNVNHYLSVKHEYVISYNGSTKVPNWVSWESNSSWLGSQSRSNDFRPDDTLPTSIPQAQLSDYSGSGYNRGHMCPSMARTDDSTDNSDTFYLTNMVPQANNNDAGPWEKLEGYQKSLAQAGKELFTVAGGIFSATSKTIGAGVTIPDSTWAVITVLDSPGQGPADVTTSTRVIAIVMPNDNSTVDIRGDWQQYRVTARSIEAQTGLSFMADVDPAVRDVIENQVDNQ